MIRSEDYVFSNEVVEKVRTGTFAEGFSQAMDKLQEYPRCAKLRRILSLMLDAVIEPKAFWTAHPMSFFVWTNTVL